MRAQQSLEVAGPESVGPSEAQLIRARDLRRFNWLFVYTPLLIAAGIVLSLFGLLLWNSIVGAWFGVPQPDAGRTMASGLADLIFVLAALPWVLLCPLLPLGLFVGLFYARRQEVAPLRRLQGVLWSLDRVILMADQRVNVFVPRIVSLTIAASTRLARLRVTGKRLIRFDR